MRHIQNGLPIDERPIVAPYRRPERGYGTSVFFAKLMELDQGSLVPSRFNQNTVVPLLLFVSDYPHLVGFSFYDDISHSNTVAWPALIQRQPEDACNSGDVAAAPFTDVITSAQASVAPGELAIGETPTNAVDIYGYLAQITVLQTLWESDAIATACQPMLELLAIAEGAVAHCPVPSGGLLGYDEGTLLTEAPVTAIVLAESDYTQAMHDADDQFTDASGLIAQIVGLHCVEAIA